MDVYQNNSNLIVNQNNPVNPDKEIEIVLASPWERILASLINSLIATLVCIVGLIIFILVFGNNVNNNVTQIVKQITNDQIMTINLSFFITFFIYLFIPLLILTIIQFLWMSKYGQSIGKRIMNIKVIGENGQNPGFIGTVLIREILFNLIIKIILLILSLLFVRVLHMDEEFFEFSFGYITPIACLIMLFITSNNRRTLQDYLAKTLVIKA